MKKNFFILTVFAVALLLAPQNKGWASFCDSLGSGNWNTAALWGCGHVPGSSDDVGVFFSLL